MSDSAPKKPGKTISPGTVFDVKRPGRTPVQPTSRPVIVGHKPMVRDPFTTGKTASDGPLLQPKQKVTIPAVDPPSPKPEAAEGSKAPATAASPELAAVAAELAAAPRPAPAPAAPEMKSESAVDTSKSAVDNDATTKEQPDESKDVPKDFVPGAGGPILPPEPVVEKQAPLSPELRKQMEAAAHETIPAPEPKGVVVSGDHGPLSIAKVLLWCLAVIVLVVVIGDVLLDAGTITTSVNIPHTNFIK
jgi:hypothetical protein